MRRRPIGRRRGGMNGGGLIAEVLKRRGVSHLFTLCGGHIAPILVECKRRGIQVIDTRHEATAAFAADAMARLTGVPGVVAVTAGPGLTNTITAIKNAQMAQSPLILLGGATATVLRGRGSLQDIDQLALLRPHVKWMAAVKRVRDLVPALEAAFEMATAGVPGPVFVECPVDLLYDAETVKSWYVVKSAAGKQASWKDRLIERYLRFHTGRLFAGVDKVAFAEPSPAAIPDPPRSVVRQAAARLARAERPVIVVGSGALQVPQEAEAIASAIERIGAPVFLSGSARGLLGAGHPLQLRHGRRDALKRADVVVLAGVPCDFRLDYGKHIGRRAFVIGANRSYDDLVLNRAPDLAVHADPGRLIQAVAATPADPTRWAGWLAELKGADARRDEGIARDAAQPADSFCNPLAVCAELEKVLPDDSILVADGGDFVATASYIVRPRRRLAWLDPGVFGTLGVGGGFAIGAQCARPSAQTWIVYGDGSVGYSLAEFDTYVRHRLPVIALVGVDASWMQIAREQVDVLGDACGTELLRTDYHKAAEGLGGVGLEVRDPAELPAVFAKAQEASRAGRPVLINAQIGRTAFRKGSISI